MRDHTRTIVAIAAAASLAFLGIMLRGMAPELVRYIRIKRM